LLSAVVGKEKKIKSMKKAKPIQIVAQISIHVSVWREGRILATVFVAELRQIKKKL
jgi:hypothetical protein